MHIHNLDLFGNKKDSIQFYSKLKLVRKNNCTNTIIFFVFKNIYKKKQNSQLIATIIFKNNKLLNNNVKFYFALNKVKVI